MFEVSIKGQRGGFKIAFDMSSQGLVSALFGPSGSGKTTIIYMLSGLIRPQEGFIRLNGETLFESARNIDVPVSQRRLACVFQQESLFPHLNVYKNLVYSHWIKGRRVPRERFDEIVGGLELETFLNRSPQSLSGGEKQRVAIGRALLSNPRALLMDEPLAGLDARLKDEILPLLERLSQQISISVVYVSHTVEEVCRLAHSVVMIKDGQNHWSGSTAAFPERLKVEAKNIP